MATDLGKAFVQIVPSAQGISGSIEGVLNKEAGGAGNKAGMLVGAGIKKMIAAAGIGVALKKTLDAGANLQQSYGGLDTIYGDAADAAKKYANEAYKAGVSTNTYAEQAVSFGASLKQAYEGDTAKAVEAANTAILDMTDNAAKMGTPIENIQNAYQGFAKQNYTMLDNLKLGYGGTKTEMERLLADAEKISGQEYNIDNLGDVYEAIHVIQGELGLTGVAAQEASETFSGSFQAMKAAGENLMANLMLGQDVGPAMENLVTTTTTFLFNNLLPAVGRIFLQLPTAIKTAVTTAAPIIGEQVTTLIATCIENAPKWIEMAKTGILKFVAGIQTQLPQIAEKAGTIIESLARGFVTHLPQILGAILKLGKFLLTNIGKISLTIWKAGLSIVKSLGKGLASGIASSIGSAMNKIKKAMTKPIDAARDTIKKTVDKIKGFFPLKAGKIFSGLKLPHFSVSAGSAPFGLGGKGTKPSISVSWYKKAENQPYLFERATLFGAGEDKDEILYGKQNLMRDIREASAGNGNIINIYNTINGADDPEAWGSKLVKQLRLELRTI